MEKASGMCDFLLRDQAAYEDFFWTINDDAALRYLQQEVNGAKGKLFAHNTLRATDAKAANGAASYIDLINQEFSYSAKLINDKMDFLVGNTNQAGFSDFVGAYEREWQSVKSAFPSTSIHSPSSLTPLA
ncbi:hypothetical protein PQX77_015174 [Marasmius sp. AFHP31]|nr:hypothetical protein PQX77_015174 [Marasmius sp. AFHP31]